MYPIKRALFSHSLIHAPIRTHTGGEKENAGGTEHTKEPYILSKEPYILSKEPYILSKEPYFRTHSYMHPYAHTQVEMRKTPGERRSLFLTLPYSKEKRKPLRLSRHFKVKTALLDLQVCVRVYVCVYLCGKYVYMCVYIHTCMYVCIHLEVYICIVCVGVCVCVYSINNSGERER